MGMKKIPVSELEKDMVLAKDTLTKDGKVLLANGTTVKEKHKGILEKRDISEVFIITEENEGEGIVPDEKPEPIEAEGAAGEVIKKIEKVFSKVRDNSNMEKLFELAIQKADKIKPPVK